MNTVTVHPRQCGMTTLSILYALYEALENPGLQIYWIAWNRNTSLMWYKDAMEMIRNASLTGYHDSNGREVGLRIGRVTDASIRFTNGSVIKFKTQTDPENRSHRIDRLWLDTTNTINLDEVIPSLNALSLVRLFGQDGLLEYYQKLNRHSSTVYQVLPVEEVTPFENKEKENHMRFLLGKDWFKKSYRPDPYPEEELSPIDTTVPQNLTDMLALEVMKQKVISMSGVAPTVLGTKHDMSGFYNARKHMNL